MKRQGNLLEPLRESTGWFTDTHYCKVVKNKWVTLPDRTRGINVHTRPAEDECAISPNGVVSGTADDIFRVYSLEGWAYGYKERD